ncbi:hypothetical protein GCM10011512_14730 [Tersicoccus solisilvae]|uniref:DUF4440 domain-containing protein n=1 Tax=Tersicoccus solisilvae TaxID=1882339 RepID=A0ABQ1P215_9MICC|nr:DUF4440 domain-containing protein [Tersicoccus solisilvae]GGC88810.1 hypothetical protein GCM10011512_14730 [Tersicoccus solisilvae]
MADDAQIETNDDAISPDQVDELVGLMNEAADAYIRGDIDRYLELLEHPEDFTLMAPFGGPTTDRGEDTPEARATTRKFFAAGEATFEVDRHYVSGSLVVLVGVERQHGEVGGLPDQDWSLRVTLVFRRAGHRWQLVHRHADALVHPISFDLLAELARGTEDGTR